MAIRAEAFLDIESSLSDRLYADWQKESTPLLKKIWSALEAGDQIKAVSLANNIDLSSLVEKNADYINYLSTNALVFGATRITPDPRLTSIPQGNFDDVLASTHSLLHQSVKYNVEDYLRFTLLEAIARYDLDNPATNYTPPDGRLADYTHNVVKYSPDQIRDWHGRWEDEGGKLRALYSRIAKPDGGFTYQPVTDDEPTAGFALSIYPDRSFSKPVAELQYKDVVDYAINNADLLEKADHYLGAWHDRETGTIFLDISMVTQDEQQATELSLKYDQIGYFNLKEGKSIIVNREAQSGGAVKKGVGNGRGSETDVASSQREENAFRRVAHQSLPQANRAGAYASGTGRSTEETGSAAEAVTIHKEWDESLHPRDEKGQFAVAGVHDLPPEAGTTPIPEGHVRLYHQTSEEAALSIAESGLTMAHAKGIEGPRAIYASETGFYGKPGDKTTVEFSVPKERWIDPFVVGGDVTPKELLAVHLGWHSKARYIESHPKTLEQVLAGQFDDLTEDDYGPAIAYIKAKHGAKKWDEEQHPRNPAGTDHGGEWTSVGGTVYFKKSLGIKRKDMPQIREADLPEFVEWAKEQGVAITTETANVSSLKPTQNEYNPANAAQLPAFVLDKPLTISKDNYVLDGTNRYVRQRDDDPHQRVNVRRIDLPVREALKLMLKFPKAFSKDVGHIGRAAKIDYDEWCAEYALQLTAKWDEEKHPRDDNGRWTSLGAMLGALPTKDDPNLRADATTMTGRHVLLGPKFYAHSEAHQKEILTHEAAHFHGMDDWYLANHEDWDLAAKTTHGNLNGQTTPGEIIVEAYSLLWHDPEFLKANAPDLIPLVESGAEARNLPLPKHVKKWDEEDEANHPRAPSGTPEGGQWSKQVRAGELGVGVTFDPNRKTWVHPDREVTEREIAVLKSFPVPPAWVNVHVNPDPTAPLQVLGQDAAERWQPKYSVKHTKEAAVAKFARGRDYNEIAPRVTEQIERDMTNPDKVSEAAAMRLIQQTGIRIGGEKGEGVSHTAIGASNLKAQHVKVDGDKITLSFTGKSAVRQHMTLTDPLLASYIRGRNLQKGDLVFGTTDAKMREYFKEVTGDRKFMVKDVRMWVGTATALKELKKMKEPKSVKEFKERAKIVATKVSKVLGNTPAMAMSSYIDPLVWQPWNAKFPGALEPKKRVKKSSETLDEIQALNDEFYELVSFIEPIPYDWRDMPDTGLDPDDSEEDARRVIELDDDPLDLRKQVGEVGQKAETLYKAEIVHPFVSFREEANSTAERMLQLVSGLHTSRLSAYGFVVEAEVTGVTTYAISAQLDNRVCPVCEYLHGMEFEVDDAASALGEILKADNPDDLRTLQPWPKQDERNLEEMYLMTPEELVDRNWHIPPYHPNCRCLLVKTDSVHDVTQTPSYRAAFPALDSVFTNEAVLNEALSVDEAIKIRTLLGGETGPRTKSIWNELKDTYSTDVLEAVMGTQDAFVQSGGVTFPYPD